MTRTHGPIPALQIKELKKTVTDYGINAPYVLIRLKELANYVLTPNDWKLTMRAILTSRQYVCFLQLLAEKLRAIATSGNAGNTTDAQWYYDMLFGSGEYAEDIKQIGHDLVLYERLAQGVEQALMLIPEKGPKKVSLQSLKQGNAEPFTDFCARVTEVVTRTMGEVEGTAVVRKDIL